ncbi:hypothetical protein [Blastococcus sp. SYSU D00813]
MHDRSEPPSAEPPARSGGPRHAAPEGRGARPSVPPSWRPDGTGSGHRAAHRRRGPWPAVALAATAAAAIAALVVVASVRDDAGDGAGRDAAGPGTAVPASPAPDAAPPALLDWLRSELPDDGTVTAPAGVRDALLRAGADPAVLPDAPPDGAADAAVPALVLVETAPEGGRVLARFDRAGALPLLLVDPAPVAPTAEQRRQRASLAAAVLANPTSRAEADAREVLAAGDVDARLLTVIAALTAQDGVGVWDFPAPPGEEPGAAPARRVVVDAVGGRPVPADGSATQRLVAWLEAQLAPFAPDTVEVTGDGVLVGFAYVPGPDAVVAAATP